ncbi:MAG: thioredoxin family protein [Chthoniobacterales bacterium]
MKKILALLTTLVALAALTKAAPQIGQPAPDFTLTGTDGQEHKLSDYKGKFIVLEWTNYDCPFVHKHYDSGNMQKLQKEYTAKDVVWLSIISSAPGKQGHLTPEQAKQTAEEKGAAPTAVLLDGDGTVGHLYEAKTTPHMYVVNPEGQLIYMGAIDSVKSPDPATIEGATNYVAQALEEAMAGKPVSTPDIHSYGCSIKY